MMMNRKASLMDNIFIMVLLVMGILAVGFMMSFMQNAFSTPAFAAVANTTNAGRQQTNFWTKTFPGGLGDTMLAGTYVLSHIAVLVLAALIPVSGIFFVLNIVFILLAVMLSSYIKSAAIAAIASWIVFLPMTWWIIDHLVVLELVFAVITVIVTFLANKAGDGA